MELTQGTQATVPVSSSTSSTGLFGTKIPSSIAFLLAILLFLLPFAEIQRGIIGGSNEKYIRIGNAQSLQQRNESFS